MLFRDALLGAFLKAVGFDICVQNLFAAQRSPANDQQTGTPAGTRWGNGQISERYQLAFSDSLSSSSTTENFMQTRRLGRTDLSVAPLVQGIRNTNQGYAETDCGVNPRAGA